MSSFIQGPWTARQEFANRWRIEALGDGSNIPVTVAIVTTTVCEVGRSDGGESAAANAALLASAPDLLNTLRTIVALADECKPTHSGYDGSTYDSGIQEGLNSASAIAEKAIAKATGEAPQ